MVSFFHLSCLWRAFISASSSLSNKQHLNRISSSRLFVLFCSVLIYLFFSSRVSFLSLAVPLIMVQSPSSSSSTSPVSTLAVQRGKSVLFRLSNDAFRALFSRIPLYVMLMEQQQSASILRGTCSIDLSCFSQEVCEKNDVHAATRHTQSLDFISLNVCGFRFLFFPSADIPQS